MPPLQYPGPTQYLGLLARCWSGGPTTTLAVPNYILQLYTPAVSMVRILLHCSLLSQGKQESLINIGSAFRLSLGRRSEGGGKGGGSMRPE